MSFQSGAQSQADPADTAAANATWPPDLADDHSFARNQVIGNYRLLEQVGAGGMGVVYRAEQLAPVQRTVAVKLVKLGLDTPQIVARFESERQALAVLEHPGIARVYDAGTTDTGRPYFVMEFVAGRPIGEYCDAQQLATDDRLELFEQVCHAVQHAHYKGILHRDLKPANILITQVDGQPQIKIIDFGIAKAMQVGQGSPLTTHVGQFVGTPLYTSPEQLAGEDVDTRADVFSMGVVLYELLSGTLPWDSEQVAKRERSSEPLRPSTRLSTLGAGAIPLARVRDTDATTLCRQLRGDVDRIIMKAMHPDRAQRYDTASALGEDIRRHLAHEPILARPPTLSYQARNFARRNRVLVGALAMVLAAIVAGGVLAAVGLYRARQALAREAAARQAEKLQREAADQVSNFLGLMLASADPKSSLGKPVLMRDVLDRASAEVDTRFAQQPVVAASLHSIIAQTYHSLALFEQARAHAQAAVDLRRRVLGEDHVETLRAMNTLGMALRALSRYNDAEKLLRELVERRRRVSGPDDPETCSAEESLAILLLNTGRAKEAEPLIRHSVDVCRRVLGEEHADTLAAMNNMAAVESSLGRLGEAEKLHRSVAEIRQRTLGPDHPWTLLSQRNLTAVLLRQGRQDEAEPILRDVLGRSERTLGPDHLDTMSLANSLAAALRLLDRLDESEALFREVADRARRSLPQNHTFALKAFSNLGLLLEHRNKDDEALACYREIWDRLPVTEVAPRDGANYASQYALLLVRLKRLDEAEKPLLEAKRRLEVAGIASGWNMRNVLAGLVGVYEKTGRADQAQEWRDEVKRLDSVLNRATSKPGL